MMNNQDPFTVLAYLGMLIFGLFLLATMIQQTQTEQKVEKLEQRLYNFDKKWKLKGKI